MKNNCYVTLNKEGYWIIARDKPYSFIEKLVGLFGIKIDSKQEFPDVIHPEPRINFPTQYHSLVAAKFVAQTINKLNRKPTPNEWIVFYQNRTKKDGN